MNIILLEKMGNLGDIGDTAEVKAGFARNFLFPKGKAIPATAANLQQFEARRGDLMAAHDENVRKAEARKAQVDGMTISIAANASDEGKLYGSVGTRHIANAVNEEKDIALSKSEVLLPHGVIRQTGEYEVALDLGYEVSARITLTVATLGKAGAVSDDGSMIAEIEAQEAAEAEAKAAAEAEAKAAALAAKEAAKSKDEKGALSKGLSFFRRKDKSPD